MSNESANATDRSDERYPDAVLKSRCRECGEAFYPRAHPNYCVYCGAEDPLNEGNGVVCHHPSQRSQDAEGDRDE